MPTLIERQTDAYLAMREVLRRMLRTTACDWKTPLNEPHAPRH